MSQPMTIRLRRIAPMLQATVLRTGLRNNRPEAAPDTL
jgi:hypothetical protein